MKVIEFRVICSYANNQYQITTEEHQYEHLACICRSVSELTLKTFTITRDVRTRGDKAVFFYE